MQIQKLEGRVFVLLNINKNGNVTNIKVETDYFGKIYEIEKFTNEKRIEKLRSKIENRLVPLFNDCCQNIVFCIPETNNEDTIRIPVSFGTYDDFDDLGISDDFDDYDYNDDFDYHYFDYD